MAFVSSDGLVHKGDGVTLRQRVCEGARPTVRGGVSNHDQLPRRLQHPRRRIVPIGARTRALDSALIA